MSKYDVGIIGAGISGAFAALRISQHHPNVKTIVFDLGRPPGKRRRQLEGWFGCFPAGDGKIYPNDLEQLLDAADGRKAHHANKWVMDIFSQVNSMKLVKDPSPAPYYKKRILGSNLTLQTNDYFQWKPDSVHALSRLISDMIEKSGCVDFSFNNEVYSIIKRRGVFHVTTADGEFVCKRIIVSAGRSGWRWATKLFKSLGLDVDDDYATIGIRAELSSPNIKELNRSHCTLYRDDLEVGPFSWFGSIIPEDHADVAISSFRSNEDRWKSDKVSFNILSPRYFKNEGCYQSDRLAKLAFLLFNDRVTKEKIKLFIKGESQLCLLEEYSWLTDVIKELDNIIPNLIQKGYFYAPTILPMAAKLRIGTNLESELDGFFVTGETAGFRGIAAAAISGCIAADSSCK